MVAVQMPYLALGGEEQSQAILYFLTLEFFQVFETEKTEKPVITLTKLLVQYTQQCHTLSSLLTNHLIEK